VAEVNDHPGVIAPPPAIFFGFLLAGVLIDRLALGLIILGLAIEGWAGGLFKKAGTNVVPWSPSTALVTDGPYRYSRNPMYLGFAVTYLGLALGLESGAAVILLIPALALMSWGVIGREERYLEAKFGEDYRAYRKRVRRWL
jgi:protein-S-isoprenylcysteine O-methyltransferase Ste14